MIRSSYVLWSIAISLLLWRNSVSGDWASTIESYLPPILGFSFAALAIMTAIGDDEFRRKMSAVNIISEDESDLTTITANFCWFIFIQILALILALIFRAEPIPDFCKGSELCVWYVGVGNDVIGFAGSFLLIYSLLLIISAISQMLSIFRLYLRSVGD